MTKACYCIAMLFFSIVCANAQEKCPTKFEKVSLNDFSEVYKSVDSSAAAIVIADIGRVYFESNNKEWFSTVFETFNRSRIQNKSAFDLGTIEITLHKDGNYEEKITNIEAYTYNLVNGEIIKDKVKKEDIVLEKKSDNTNIQKFTFPNVKVGSIIEYKYSKKSDFINNLPPWTFQTPYPVLWSEYETKIPAFFIYNAFAKGYYEFNSKTEKSETASYTVRYDKTSMYQGTKSEIAKLETTDNITKWIIKNLPAFKPEKFITTYKNHIQTLSFQQSAVHFPGDVYRSRMDDWNTATTKLLESKSFGEDLYRRNGWLGDELNNDITKEKDSYSKANKIFDYVKNNFKCDDEDYGIWLTSNLKDVAKKKTGSIADINLLLVALMNHEGLKSNPVILSTRNHGKAYPILPILNDYNYVICEVIIDSNKFYLDASNPLYTFNKININCYNGVAKSINSTLTDNVYFFADNLLEEKTTSIDISLNTKDPNNLNWEGALESDLGFNESFSFRYFKNKKGIEETKKEISKQYSDPFNVKNINFENLDKLEESAKIKYNFGISIEGDNNVLYLNPLIKEGNTTNYFKSEERNYPVEMPYKSNEIITVKIKIPEGYIIDELPKNIRVKMADDKAKFNYKIIEENGVLTVTSELEFNQANYSVEDYYDLQAFYNYVVKKHSEQIIFKKK